MRGKKLSKTIGGRIKNATVWVLVLSLTLSSNIVTKVKVQAESCPDLRVVFARGSGGERWKNADYLEYKAQIEEKLKTTNLKYEFIDLNYPAVAIGIDKIKTTLGAYIGGGDSYEFGESVKKGVQSLQKMVNSSVCKNTKYVIGGYSQGAMVVSKSLSGLNANRVIYVATFGDPKLYLPEGKGPMPAACSGRNLSDYRTYVPDCMAYKGMLGGLVPYQPADFKGKLGTWCNKMDVMCSTHLGITDHVNYISDGLYEDASRLIFDKITKAFGIENHVSSPHDTAILIDSSGSMGSMIEKYKEEAFRLAKETLDSGGRVALFDYRDLDDPYTPVQYCDFEACTLKTFLAGLEQIHADGGGDTPESMLSASFHTMKKLNWKRGATKSLVILTDAGYLSPDRDGISPEEAIKLSKEIDPVNFYIITTSECEDVYQELAMATDGKVVTNFDELSLLTDFIISRYDSLPRVEETSPVKLPVLTIKNAGGDESVFVEFDSNGEETIVILNDTIVGMTSEQQITITGLDRNKENNLRLVPVLGEVKGEGVEIKIETKNSYDMVVPKVPNTGRAS